MAQCEVVDMTMPGFFSSEDFTAAKILLSSRTVVEGTCFMPGRSGDTRHETIHRPEPRHPEVHHPVAWVGEVTEIRSTLAGVETLRPFYFCFLLRCK